MNLRTNGVATDPVTRLLGGVSQAPEAPLQFAVVGPGGYGKTAALRSIREVYRNAGQHVLTEWSSTTNLSDAVVLVDDAHLMDEARIDVLLSEPCPRMVVAARPWPRPAALGALLRLVSRSHQPVVPATLGPEGVRQALATMSVPVSRELAEHVHTLTGGVPGWVFRVGQAWLADGVTDGLPAAAVSSFRRDLELLAPQVQRYLIAVLSGAGSKIDLLKCLLHLDDAELADVVGTARATGMLAASGGLLPLCAEAVATMTAAEHRFAVRQRMAELQLQRPDPLLGFACTLLGTGSAGAEIAGVLRAAAGEALLEDAALAARLYEESVAAGAPRPAVIPDWARAAALSGDLDTALRLADQAISGEDPAARTRGARVAAAALAHRGQLGRSAVLYRWAEDGPFAEIASIGIGEPVPRQVLAGATPTLFDGAAALMADGITKSVSGNQSDALATLVRASAMLEPAGPQTLLPDSPAALAALVAMHCGELDVALSTLDGAMQARVGGTLLTARHTLLRAWGHMVRGQLTSAAQLLATVTAQDARLEPRDRLFAVALDVGIARRSADEPALRLAWAGANDCLMRHPIDLFTFLPLGELFVASARLRGPGQLGAPMREAFALAGRLGNPSLWVTPLHWYCVQAAIAGEQLDVGAEHARLLAADRSGHGVALATAATCWLDVVAGRIDTSRVQRAARALHAAGLWWDGARLASEAAIRTADRASMSTLLDCARQLQVRQQKVGRLTRDQIENTTSDDKGDGAELLSDREREVAELVVQGMTYKQVGDRLFISAKTVEHHMARMRRRLGVATRSELLVELRGFARHSMNPG
jgi:DNA-binding CsgD family transcriptional regulator